MFSLLCVVCVHQSKSARTQLRLPDSRGPSDRRTVVNSTWRWMVVGVQGGGGAFSDKCPTISDQHGGQWSASPIIDEPDTDTTTTDWDTSDDMARGYLHAIWPIESEYYLHTNMGPTNMRRPEHANIIYNKQSPPRPLPTSTHISMKCLTKAANMYSTRTQISACRSFLDRNYNVHLQLIATRIIF